MLTYKNTCCTTVSAGTIIVPKECRYFEVDCHVYKLVLNQELEYVFIHYDALVCIEEIYIWKNASVRLVNSLISSLSRNLRLDEEARLYTVRASLLSKKLIDLEFYAECRKPEYKELIDEAFKYTNIVVY